MNLQSITHRLWKRSPALNFEWLKAKFGLHSSLKRNDMLDPLLELSAFPSILAWCLGKVPDAEIFLLGDAQTITSWRLDELLTNKRIHVQNWTWTDSIGPGRSIICLPPYSDKHWCVIAKANSDGGSITTLGELVAPFLQVHVLMNQFDYFIKSMNDVIPIYLGQRYFGPLKELDELFPLRDKTVIEFGCFDGYQTLGLCHLGARLTCMDARADNVIKTRAAASAVGFGVQILMDDFHNAHPNKYGRFDLAFAHGVYYHSVAPFVFLENLVSLSDHIFVGGFCATDSLPATSWSDLAYQGRSYRAKAYTETVGFTAGLNNQAWFRRLSIDLSRDLKLLALNLPAESVLD